MTERELLECHVKILSLQEELGTSYKDASHRLYFAHWERMKAQEQSNAYLQNMVARSKRNCMQFRHRIKMLSDTMCGDIAGKVADKNIQSTQGAVPTSPPSKEPECEIIDLTTPTDNSGGNSKGKQRIR
jgi:hypothetical protein